MILTLVSNLAAELLPIGTLGRGILKQADFLPDGRIITVLANRIEIQDAETGRAVASFAERNRMGRFVISPDGLWVGVMNLGPDYAPSSIEIWDIGAQQRLHHWDTSAQIAENVRALAFSPTPPMLAVAAERAVHLWNWETESYLGKLVSDRPADPRTSRHINRSLEFSPDGERLAVGRWELGPEVWDVSTQELIAHLDGYSNGASRAAYSPDGRRLATTPGQPPTVQLWDAQTNMWVRSLPVVGAGVIRQLFFSKDSRRIYVVSSGSFGYCRAVRFCDIHDDRVRIFDVDAGEQVGELGDIPRLQHASLSPDGSRALLSYAGSEGAFALWDIARSQRLDLRADYWMSPYRRRMSPDGQSLVVSTENTVKVWDVASRSLRHAIFATESEIGGIAVSPDGQRFVVHNGRNYEVRDIHSGEIVMQTHYPNSSLWPTTFSSDGRRFAFYAGTVQVVDIKPPNQRQSLELNPSWRFAADGRTIAFNSDDSYLAAADWDGGIHLWQRNRHGRYIYRYSWRSKLNSFQITFRPHKPDKSLIPTLLVSRADETQVWRLDPKRPRNITPKKFEEMGGGRFSRDGQYIFMNKEYQFQVWDWRRQKLIPQPQIPRYLSANGDGSVLLTESDQEGKVLVWNLRNQIYPKPVRLGEVKQTALLANFPNPLNPETWIPYQLAEAARVQIKIYDGLGRLVRAIDLGDKPAGSYFSQEKAAYWDGRNDMGEAVSSGVYFYTLAAGEYRTTRRMSVVR